MVAVYQTVLISNFSCKQSLLQPCLTTDRHCLKRSPPNFNHVIPNNSISSRTRTLYMLLHPVGLNPTALLYIASLSPHFLLPCSKNSDLKCYFNCIHCTPYRPSPLSTVLYYMHAFPLPCISLALVLSQRPLYIIGRHLPASSSASLSSNSSNNCSLLSNIRWIRLHVPLYLNFSFLPYSTHAFMCIPLQSQSHTILTSPLQLLPSFL